MMQVQRSVECCQPILPSMVSLKRPSGEKMEALDMFNGLTQEKGGGLGGGRGGLGGEGGGTGGLGGEGGGA